MADVVTFASIGWIFCVNASQVSQSGGLEGSTRYGGGMAAAVTGGSSQLEGLGRVAPWRGRLGPP